MAVQSILIGSSLSISYKAGIDATGRDLIKTKKYPNIKVTAAASDLLFIGTALDNLMKNKLVEVQKAMKAFFLTLNHE